MKLYLDILKKYWLSFVCALVAVAAVLAVMVWPLPGMVTALQGKVDERKGVFNNVEQLRNANRPMPVIDPASSTAAELDVFPNDHVIEAGEKATTEVNAEAMKMLDLAVRTNAQSHTLLLEGSLPEPSDPVRFQFRDVYIDAMIQDPEKHQGRPLLFKDQILHAIFPPSPAELEAAKAAVEMKYAQAMAGAAASAADLENNRVLKEKEIAALPDVLRAIRSKEGLLYLSPDALSVNPTINGNSAPPTDQIWSAQLMVWIQQDFCRAVAATNSVALSALPPDRRKDVTNAPIKHLIKLLVAPDPRIVAVDPHTDPNAPLPDQPTISLSKRVSNGLYDAYKFNVTMNVETAHIPQVLVELSRNQFLTVTKVDAKGIDSLAALQLGYVYGTQPISTLEMEVELLYMKKWIEPFMPAVVKARTGPGVPGGPPGFPGFPGGRPPDE